MDYITEYTLLDPKEARQLSYKRKFKLEYPAWDDSMVLLRDLVDKQFTENTAVLDAGCGHGNYIIDELRKKFSYAVGIDVSREVTAKNICLDEVVIGNLENLPFPEKQFDLVVSLWVLEHLEYPEKVFREIYRVLKPGGKFVFVTPNKGSFLVFLRRCLNYPLAQKLVKWLYGREEGDVFPVRYKINNIKTIRSVARRSGFVEEVLQENVDPSYTSFGSVSYRISAWASRLHFSLFHPHIVGILKKI